MLSLINTLNLAYSRSNRGIRGSSLPLLIRASQTLDLSAYPHYQAEDRGIEAALLIKEVLDRVPLPRWDDIPGDREVRAGNDDAALLRLLGALRASASGGLPTTSAPAGPVDRWVLPGTQIEIVRITEGPNAGRYLFSAETVARIYSDYELVRNLPYRFGATPDIYVAYVSTPGKGLNLTWAKRYPDWSHYRLFEQTLWQWAAAILSLLLMVVFCAGIIRWALRRDTPPPEVEGDVPQRTRRIRSILAIATAAAATQVVQYFIDDVINITGGPLYGMIQVFIVVRFAFLAWALALLIIEIADLVIAARNLPRRSPRSHLILFGARLAALIGVVVVVIIASQEIGLPVYSVVTGLGIGGLGDAGKIVGE
jgi:MscS family membrane protein